MPEPPSAPSVSPETPPIPPEVSTIKTTFEIPDGETKVSDDLSIFRDGDNVEFRSEGEVFSEGRLNDEGYYVPHAGTVSENVKDYIEVREYLEGTRVPPVPESVYSVAELITDSRETILERLGIDFLPEEYNAIAKLRVDEFLEKFPEQEISLEVSKQAELADYIRGLELSETDKGETVAKFIIKHLKSRF